MGTARNKRQPSLPFIPFHSLSRHFPKTEVFKAPALGPYVTRIWDPYLRDDCAENHPDCKPANYKHLWIGASGNLDIH